jgi:hypothetical protein
LNAQKKDYLQDLTPRFAGFRLLTGCETQNKYGQLLNLMEIAVEKPRTGTLTKLCDDYIAGGGHVVIINPETEAMRLFLNKHNFFLLYSVKNTFDAWIKGRYTHIVTAEPINRRPSP